MISLLSPMLELLALYGPWMLLVMAILETSFLTGLVVPSGLATAAATVMALDGRMGLVPVVAAALCGGAIGDSLGFWIGRAWGERVFSESGRWSRAMRRRHDDFDELFDKHPMYSVTAARLIAFVRTVMPIMAGMSEITYRRFLAYELVGVVAWAAAYVGLGLAARESWEVATRVFGIGGSVVFVVVGLVVWRVVRRRRNAHAGVS